jgi:hypothetical protein
LPIRINQGLPNQLLVQYEFAFLFDCFHISLFLLVVYLWRCKGTAFFWNTQVFTQNSFRFLHFFGNSTMSKIIFDILINIAS